MPEITTSLETTPNPTRDQAEVRYALVRAGEASVVGYDALGREVAALARGPHEAGHHTAALDASGLAPGVCFVRLTMGSADMLARLTVVR